MRTSILRGAAVVWAAALAVSASAQTTTAPLTGGADQAPAAQGDGARTALGQIGAPPGAISIVEGIAILNLDLLLGQSLYGQRIQRELDAALQQLAAENREIEARLTAEELSLTEQRQSMDPDAFRALAEDFDRRVEAIRSEQDAKARSLNTQTEQARALFFERAFPVLLELVEARGASVLMDSRSVLLAAAATDITPDAVEELNAALGEGGPAPLITIGDAP